ncbi:MAG: choice-of-anchor Q domain-containing protein [bacterium]
MIESDVKLGSLQDNGGPTQTILPLFGSPAINNGNNGTCEVTDQRGYSRGSDCDIGATERLLSDNIGEEHLKKVEHVNNPASFKPHLRK